ncbi:MAG: hypothetical protein BWK79_02105 [Beggiatoa sp. IS2]|nr:MAG: hypothetical protein BWK79_02105 [Beggiatoa sp. IS2]
MLPHDSLQMMVVTTQNWDRFEGEMQLFARETLSASWQTVSSPEKVVTGKNGLGWDYDGLLSGMTGPVKQEGDGKAPAGIFYLGTVFGDAPALPFLKMPYLQISDSLVCVDDTHSKYYNCLVNLSQWTESEHDWNSDEKMKRTDALYQWGVVVNHNISPTVPGRGSCIFLHLWRDSSTPTAGCTAMSLPVMERLLAWLDINKKPILVQLPRTEKIVLSCDFRFKGT